MASFHQNGRCSSPINHWSVLWCVIAALASLGRPGGVGAAPLSSLGAPLNYHDVVIQQTPIRVIRCPQCETNTLILATETDVSRSKKSGFSDQRIAELEGMLMNNRVRKSGFSDQRLAEIEASLFNGNKMRRSGFSDQRIAEMEAMLMNSMKRPAQRAMAATDQSSEDPSAVLDHSFNTIAGDIDVVDNAHTPELKTQRLSALKLKENPNEILKLLGYPSADSLIIGSRPIGWTFERITGVTARPVTGSTHLEISPVWGNGLADSVEGRQHNSHLNGNSRNNKHAGAVKVDAVEKRSGFSDQRMAEMETMVLSQVRNIRGNGIPAKPQAQ